VITPPRRSGMARVLKGSHSFACTPRVYPQRYEQYLPLPSQPKLVLIYGQIPLERPDRTGPDQTRRVLSSLRPGLRHV